jgi:multicomponent Na+:H+ antiporter subunit D
MSSEGFLLHPAFPLLLGALLVPFFRAGLARGTLLVMLPIVGLLNLLQYEAGFQGVAEFAGLTLDVVRVDKLSLLFGYLFHIAAFLGAVYSLHVRDATQHTTALMYAGSAVGAVFAGDLVTLFIFWELLAVTSVFQIWARKTEQSYGAGFRYLLMHIGSGLLLLAGIAIYYHDTGSLGFGHMSIHGEHALGPQLMLLGVGIKACFPPFHTWLVDSYPNATPTGTVFLSAFTTKTAVYVLARGYAGTEELVWIGGAMAMFPIFYAVIENDLRRVLGYSMINQIGFMVVGIGIGTDLAVNGAVAHAFNDVIFKGLLFMSMGAVLFRTGKINGSELGGLYKSMPLTAGFCMVGAASISAFPLFSGFISKSLIMAAAATEGYTVIWCILLFAAAGVFHHAGIKIPYFAFYAHDSGLRPKEAPLNMLVAMGISSFLCIFLGTYWPFLYGLLPFPIDIDPYTWTHVILQLQVLFFSAGAFVFLQRKNLYPPELPSTNIDFDFVYRRLLKGLWRRLAVPPLMALSRVEEAILEKIPKTAVATVGADTPIRRRLPEAWTHGSVVVLVTVMLGIYLALNLLG